MGGKSKKITTGYRYRVAFHHGLAATPIDALLEIRCADKTAWSGELTASGTIHINEPNLFGGDKDQGGIVGDVDLMLGKLGQQPNGYLAATFGPQQPAWLGVTTLVFKGGQFGSNNPYPQAPAYKVRAIKMGWDGDPGDGSKCWYPAKASVQIAAATVLPTDALGWDYQILPAEPNPGYNNLTPPTSGWTVGAQAPFGNAPISIPYHTTWPDHTILWARRAVTIGAINQVLSVAAENGCVILINGAVAGASNRSNADIDNNELNPVTFPLAAGGTFEIAVKAFDEDDLSKHGTGLMIGIQASGLTAMNPAHILYDLLTSQDRGAEPVASINDSSFRAAADWFYAQGVGLCTQYDPDSETVVQAIARVEKAAGCSVSRDPTDGLWYLDIANGIYDLATLPVLADDDILDFAESPSTLDDVVNSIAVEYVDVAQHLTLTTPPVQCLALINSAGLNSQVNQYHEAPTAALASRFAQRDLQTAITPKHAFDLTCTRKPYAWRVNTYFRLQLPKRGIADMVCLLGEKSSGTLKSGAMKLTATQDVYSLPTASFVIAEPGVDTRPPEVPVAIGPQAVFEAPYTTVCATLDRASLAALPSDVGYLMAVAAAPGNYQDYAVAVSEDGGATYADAGVTQIFCATAVIVEGDPLQDAAPASAFTVAQGEGLASVVAGSAALWDGEICRVDALDAGAGALTLGRGCADTVPVPHAPGSRVWFYDGFAAADPTERTDGEVLSVKLLTESSSQRLDVSLATPQPLTFVGRQSRPYPPAGVTLNLMPFPSEANDPVSVGFTTRNRVVQADQLIDWAAGDVVPEAGTTFTLRGYVGGSLDATLDGNAGSPIVWTPSRDGIRRVELVAVRDGIESRAFTHDFTRGGGLWTPSYLALAPSIWINDASAMTDDGTGRASSVADISGNAADFLQATPAKRPSIVTGGLNTLPVLGFNGAQFMKPTSTAKGGFRNSPGGCIFGIYNLTSMSGYGALVEVDSATASYVRAGLFGSMSGSTSRAGVLSRRLDGDSADVVTSSVARTGIWVMALTVIDYANRAVRLYINGALDAQTTAPWTGAGASSDTAAATITLGDASVGNGVHGFRGQIAELFVADRGVPSAAEVDKIFGYAAWHWGLQANLSSGHPYKSVPPMA